MNKLFNHLTEGFANLVLGPSHLPFFVKKIIFVFVLFVIILFVANRLQNGWINLAQIIHGTSHDTMEGFLMIKFLKLASYKNFKFSLNFENTRNFFFKSENIFSFCFIKFAKRKVQN